MFINKVMLVYVLPTIFFYYLLNKSKDIYWAIRNLFLDFDESTAGGLLMGAFSFSASLMLTILAILYGTIIVYNISKRIYRLTSTPD